MKCSHCLEANVIKNGIRPNGQQNDQCKSCGVQFQEHYIYEGCKPKVKASIIEHIVHNCGVKDTAKLCKVSASTVVNQVLKEASKRSISYPKGTAFKSIQIDEMWSYVGNKKAKRWLLHAYDKASKQTIAIVFGSRGIRTFRRLLKQLDAYSIGEYCTDDWPTFSKGLKGKNHKIGKQYTRQIEGVHTAFRNKIKRFNRKTTGFSKNKTNHDAFILIMIFEWNKSRKAKHH
jgi:insertion element IS1 protein InsB